MTGVLDPMQMLDQQIPPPRRIAKEGPDFTRACRVHMMAALGRLRPPRRLVVASRSPASVSCAVIRLKGADGASKDNDDAVFR